MLIWNRILPWISISRKKFKIPYLNFGRLSLEYSLTCFVFDIQRDFDWVIVFSYVSMGFFDHGTFVLERCFFRIGKLKPVAKGKNISSFDWLLIGNGIFQPWGVTNKTFQLARSIFSFHVEMFFLLGKLKTSLVLKRLKHENWNALSQLKGQIKIPRDGTWLLKSKHTFSDLVTMKSCFHSQ